LCSGEGLIRSPLNYGRSCRFPDLRIKRMKKLESMLMVSGKIVGSTLVGPELVDDSLKTAKHLLN